MTAERRTPGRGRLSPVASPRVLDREPSSQPGSVPAVRNRFIVARRTDPVQWVRVPGGRIGQRAWHRAADVPDLWWSATALAIGALPVVHVTLGQAAELAAGLGARLPTSIEWEWMASADSRLYPWGDQPPAAEHANLRATGPGRTTGVYDHPAGSTPEGLYDVAGNVWEWTTAPWRRDAIALLRGGSYNSLAQYASCAHANDAPPHLSSPGIGLRPVRHDPPSTNREPR